MSDQTTATEPPADPAPEPPAPDSKPWRDRALGFRGVVAVTLAGVVLGGLGGTALGFALDSDSGPEHVRFGSRFGDDDRPAPPGGGFQPPGLPQAPEGTVPDEDTQPDGSGDTNGSTTS